MTLFLHECKRGRVMWLIWTAVISFMLFICMIMFPEMKGQMDTISEMYANMGSFSEAFGLNSVSFGEVMNFYGIECGEVLGIGGGLFAALLGISALCGEEKNHTAEFLLSHPLSRTAVAGQKLLAVLAQIVTSNLVIAAAALGSFTIIGETAPAKSFFLIHLAFLLLQIELAFICFAFSALLRRGGVGIGLGLCIVLYFLDIIGNLTDKADFLHYLTPYSYARAADILENGKISCTYLAIGGAVSVVSVLFAFWYYRRKDIYA